MMLSRVNSLGVVLITSSLIAGCDKMYSVTHSNSYQSAVDTSCIERSVAALDGIIDVKRQDNSWKAREVLPDWGKVTETNAQRVFYKTKDVWASIGVTKKNHDAVTQISHSHYRFNSPIPNEYRVALVPVMDRVEVQLKQDCNLVFNKPEPKGDA